MRFEIETGRETEIKSGFFGSVAISPDGSQVAYLGNAPGADPRSNHIAVMPTTGGESRILYESPDWYDASRFNSIGWSQDQRYVLFVRQESPGGRNVLWRVPVTGGQAEQTGISFAGRIKSPSVHPNGRQIAFSTGSDAPAELWVLENFLPQAAVKR